jgi:hypothetical protein
VTSHEFVPPGSSKGTPAPADPAAVPPAPPVPPDTAADPGSREGTPASANPAPAPPVPPDAPADPAAAGTGPGHDLVPPPASERSRQAPPEDRWSAQDGTVPLLDRDERDRLTARLHHAVSGFVDGPRRAVEEADGVFEEAARHLEDALTQRRRVLREPWQGARHAPGGSAPGSVSGAETEELRLALRQYKEATERLLRL